MISFPSPFVTIIARTGTFVKGRQGEPHSSPNRHLLRITYCVKANRVLILTRGETTSSAVSPRSPLALRASGRFPKIYMRVDETYTPTQSMLVPRGFRQLREENAARDPAFYSLNMRHGKTKQTNVKRYLIYRKYAIFVSLAFFSLFRQTNKKSDVRRSLHLLANVILLYF